MTSVGKAALQRVVTSALTGVIAGWRCFSWYGFTAVLGANRSFCQGLFRAGHRVGTSSGLGFSAQPFHRLISFISATRSGRTGQRFVSPWPPFGWNLDFFLRSKSYV